MNEPLAIKLRPTKLKDIIGQQHLVGENKIISNLIHNKRMFSMILYGNPGIGKTSLAYVIISELGLKHRFLNAVINNKKDFDIVVEEAKMYQGIVVIMDEIHRLNKDKQDLLLPYLENGLITLIGLTTANPYYKINPAIRSRCQIFELKELTEAEILIGLNTAINSDLLKGIKIDNDSLNYIASLAAGDLRNAYNTLEMAYYSTNDHNIKLDQIKKINNKPILLYDNNETGYYDLLSAFQKSIRGSDANASIYYLAKLLEVEDLDSIYRRLTVITYEDIGLANPNMGPKVDAAIRACERVGLPEARIILSEIVIDLALSPKSNSAYLALNRATNDLKLGKSRTIPNHLKNHSKTYLYPHDYTFGYVKQQYLPDDLIDRIYYLPKTTSNYEKKLKAIYENLK